MDVEHIKNIYSKICKMQAEIDFLKSLVCIFDDVLCQCETCWKSRKYKELGGKSIMLDWKMREIQYKVSEAWILEKRNRYKKFIKN